MLRQCPCVAKYSCKEEERTDDDEFVTFPHYVGNHILFYGKKSSQFPYQLMVGPDWQCMLLSYCLVIIPTFFFLWDVGSVLGWWIYLLGGFTGFSTLLMFSITACSDPGIVYSKPQTSLQQLHEALALDDMEKGIIQTGSSEETNQLGTETDALNHPNANQNTRNNSSQHLGTESYDSIDKSNVTVHVQDSTRQAHVDSTERNLQSPSKNTQLNNIPQPPQRSGSVAPLPQAGVESPESKQPSADSSSSPRTSPTTPSSLNNNNTPNLGVLGQPAQPALQYIECGSCAMRRPTSASHCYDCGLCIDQVDHHCPWTGKCIAKKNIKTFYGFLWCLSGHIVMVIVVTMYCVLKGYNVFSMPSR